MIREKSRCNIFTIGFQKPGIYEKPHCTIFLPLDSRNQESTQIPGFCNPMVKIVQWDFSLITWGLYAYYLLNVEVPLYNGRIQPGKCGVTTVHCMATEVVTSPLSWSCGKERTEKEILNVSTVHSKLCFSA